MRGPEGARVDERRVAGQHAGDAVDLRHLERLLRRHPRQYRRRGAGEECLAGARRPDHDHVVPAGGRYLQRPLHVLLPADVPQIDAIGRHLAGDAAVAQHVRGNRVKAPQVGGDLHQRLDGDHLDAVHKRSLCRVRLGDKNRVETPLARQAHHRQNAARVAHLALQRELAQKDAACGRLRDLASGDEYPDRDREVIGRALLAKVGRGQVHRYALVGELVTRVLDGGAYPLPSLLHRGVAQTHDVEPRKPEMAYVDLHLDDFAIEADDRATVHLRQHDFLPLFCPAGAHSSTYVRGLSRRTDTSP